MVRVRLFPFKFVIKFKNIFLIFCFVVLIIYFKIYMSIIIYRAMNKSYNIKPFRLFLYSKYIGSYDLLNKMGNLKSFEKKVSFKINSLILQKTISLVQQTKKNILILGLGLEALSTQRFLLGCLQKNKKFFKITLRNNFLFLDILLNSLFLNSTNKLFFFNNVYFLFNSSLATCINFLLKNLLVSLCFFNIKLSKLIKLNFYFIPFQY